MKTALIVDDFRSIRAVVKNVLSKEGFDVLEAEDGVQALDFFDGRSIDILISDVDMPRMDGIELVKTVRQLATYSNLPVLMLTTNTFERKQDEMEGVNVNGWIQKPFDFIQFKETILKHTQ